MLVFTDVSSMKTRCVESSNPCSRIQRRRARTPSARSCSEACRTFFERDGATLQKTKQRRAAARYPALVHHRNNLVQRPVTMFLDKGDNLLRVILQGRSAAAAGLGLVSSVLPPNLMPANRRGDANSEAFGRFRPCCPFVDRFNHTFAQIR